MAGIWLIAIAMAGMMAVMLGHTMPITFSLLHPGTDALIGVWTLFVKLLPVAVITHSCQVH